MTETTLDRQSGSLRTTTLLIYILHAASCLVGVTAIVGVILAYAKKAEAQGTIYESHLTWIIRTFWIGLLVGILGVATMVFGIGLLILLAVGVWTIYRLVRGWLLFNDDKPIPDPKAWI